MDQVEAIFASEACSFCSRTKKNKSSAKRTHWKSAVRASGLLTALLTLAGAANAADIAWDGGGDVAPNVGTPSGNRNFTNPLNWVGDVVPGAADRAVFATMDVGNVVVDADVTILGISFTGAGWTINSSTTPRELSVGDGGIVTDAAVNSGTNTVAGRLRLTSANATNVPITTQSGNTLNLTARVVGGGGNRLVNGTGKLVAATLNNIGVVTLTNGTMQAAPAPTPQATAVATSAVTSGRVTGFTVTAGGQGFIGNPVVRLSPITGNLAVGTGTGATTQGNIAATAQAAVPVGTIYMTAGGSGYTSAPTVTINPIQATFSANRFTAVGAAGLNTLVSINITNPGSGYAPSSTITLTIAAAPTGGTQATATATTDASGRFTQATITNAGAGYTTNPPVTAPAPTTVSGATATALINAAGNVIGVDVTNPGPGFFSAPTVTFSGGGTGAAATALLTGPVTALSYNNPGTGYTVAPNVLINPPATGGLQVAQPFTIGAGGTYDLNGVNVATQNLVAAATGNITDTRTSGAASNLLVEYTTSGTKPIDAVLSGPLSLTTVANGGNLNNATTGTDAIQLTNPNSTFTGGVTVRRGALRVAGDVLANSASVLGRSGTITLADFGSIFNERVALFITGAIGNSFTINRPINASRGGFQNNDTNNARIRVGVDTAGVAGTFAGALTTGGRRIELISVGDASNAANGFTAPSASGGDGLADFTGIIAENTGFSSLPTINGGNGGSGAVRFSGANTFASAVTITNGTLLINANIPATGVSPLGTSGSVNISDGASPPIFLGSVLTEGPFTVSRNFNISGAAPTTTSLTALIGSLSTGASSFGAISSSTDVKVKSLQLSTPTGATVSYGAISGNADATGVVNVTKLGAGIARLTGSSTYDGTTTLSAGTLLLSGSNILPDTTSITAADATIINTGGFSDTTGPLTLPSTGTVTLDMGAGSSILTFSSFASSGGTLNVRNYSGKANTGGGADQLIFTTTLNTAQLAQIKFIDPSNPNTPVDAQLSTGSNPNEVVPVAPIASNPLNLINGTSINPTQPVLSTPEDTELRFVASNTNVLSIVDADNTSTSILRVILRPRNGRVRFNTAAANSGTSDLSNITFGSGSSETGSVVKVISGTLSAINAALQDVTFIPVANFNGAGSLQITTDDGGANGGGLVDNDTLNITVTEVNDNPTARNDSFSAAAGGTTSLLPVLQNDSVMPDTGETLSISGVSTPTNGGSATVSGTQISYISPATVPASGSDSFTYTLSDGRGGTATATVTINITAGGAAQPAAGATVTRSGFSQGSTDTRVRQVVTIRNTGSTAIVGPVYLVLDSLSSNATLVNKNGDTTATTPTGSPYIRVSDMDIAAGTSVTVVLEFENSNDGFITYTPRVLAGPGSP